MLRRLRSRWLRCWEAPSPSPSTTSFPLFFFLFYFSIFFFRARYIVVCKVEEDYWKELITRQMDFKMLAPFTNSTYKREKFAAKYLHPLSSDLYSTYMSEHVRARVCVYIRFHTFETHPRDLRWILRQLCVTTVTTELSLCTQCKEGS